MPSDRYTKLMLTVIAIGVLIVAFRPYFFPGAVQAQMNACGEESSHPCYVAGWGPSGTVPIANTGDMPLKVLVVNPPSPLGGPLRR